MTSYWVNTVSLDHALGGVDGGFVQADHGRDTRLRRLRPGGGICFYSPRTQMRAGDPVQRFTAIGEVVGDEPFRVQMTPDFHPWRVAVDFWPAEPADTRALVPRLGFVTDEKRWGLPFRRGLFRVERADFAVVAEAMGVADRVSAP